MSLSLYRYLGLIGYGLAALAILSGGNRTPAQEEREIIIRKAPMGENETDKYKDDGDDQKPVELNYWIGLAGGIVNNGLKIEQVFDNSPAAEAGLKVEDIILTVSDKKLTEIEQLVDLVQDSGGKPLTLKILRGGKEQEIVVKPAQRPANFGGTEKEDEGKKDEANRYRAARPRAPKPSPPVAAPRSVDPRGVSGFPSGPAPGQPGIARMSMSPPSDPLPDDMQVTISKKGNRPAVITATQGEKLWKTTENDMSMLPAAAQAYAARLLGKDPLRGGASAGGMPGMMPGMGGGMGMPGMPGMGGMPGMEGMRGSQIRRIELRQNRDGQIEAVQDGKSVPGIKVVPGEGGLRVKIREQGEKKEFEKGEPRDADIDRARRIRALQQEAERLRDLLEQLRKEAPEGK